MTVYLVKRKRTASRWCNFHFLADGNVFSHFVAYRTLREAKAACDLWNKDYDRWEVVKFEEKA